MGASLAELIRQHSIEMTPVYTHSEPSDGTRYSEHDVYDCFLTIKGGISLYGGRFDTRTLLIRGFGQSYRNSLPQNADNLIPPTLVEVLRDNLSNATGVDSADGDWKTWADDYGDKSDGFEGGLRAYGQYQQARRERDELSRFLGDYYEEFKNAAMDE